MVTVKRESPADQTIAIDAEAAAAAAGEASAEAAGEK